MAQFLLVMMMFASGALHAQMDYQAERQTRKLQAAKTSEKIALDGRLDEPAWANAPVAGSFIQNEPRTDQPASEKTEVRVLYDNNNIYFGVYAYDAEPRRIIITDLKKDFVRDTGDYIEIVLDTFRDERNGYRFAANAAGAKWDAQMTNEGRESNENWDGVWRVETRIVADGWIAEFEIPFKTLKFSEANPQSWGVNFMRKIRRRNEEGYWSPVPRIYGVERVSLAGTIDGLEGIKPGANIRFKPYVVTGLTVPRGGRGITSAQKKTIPFCPWVNGGSCYDADFGFDAKYGITSGLTWDFTYNTDFSQVEADEQQINLTRFNLFFPEKREFFLENSGIFQFSANPDRNPVGGGGRTNSLNNDMVLFFSRRIGLSDDGNAIPILGGTRLTGRVGTYELGFLNIQQKEFGPTNATNFTVGRVKKNFLANSDIGLMLVNKEVLNSSHFNRVLGTDANFRFGQDLNVNTYLVKSFTKGGGDEDLAARAGVTYRTSNTDLRIAYTTIQKDFVDEMGFVPRTGNHRVSGYGGKTFRPKSIDGFVRQIFPHIQWDYFMDEHGNLAIRHIDYHLPFNFQNGGMIEVGSNPTREQFSERFVINRGKNIAIPPGVYSFHDYFVTARSNTSRVFSGNINYSVGRFYSGYKHSYQVGGTYRLGYKLNTAVTFTHNNINLPQGHFKTNLLSTRVAYSFTTNMFLNALVQYNNDLQQWSSNVRFNLIHRPLSDLFVVYNDRRDSVSGDLIDRAFIVKFTYMVSR